MSDSAAEAEAARTDAVVVVWTALTVIGLTAVTGDRRGLVAPRRGEVERRLPARRAGSTPVIPRGVVRLAGGGPTAVWALLGRGSPRASALGRPPIGTGSAQSGTSLRAAGKEARAAGTAARPAVPLPTTTEGLLRGPGSATMAGRGMGTGPHARGAHPAATVWRPRAHSGASPLTFTSARNSGTPFAMATAPRRMGSRWQRLRSTGRRAARPIGRGRPTTGTDSCSAAATPESPTRPPAPRASCGTSSGTPDFRADTSPPTPIPSPAMCADSISMTWTSAGGARASWLVGSPRPFPSCGGRALTASAPATRTGRSTSFSAGTRWSGPGSTACLARRAGACTTRRAEYM